MTKNIDAFCDSLRVGLNAVDSRLKSAIENLNSLPGKSEHALQETLAELRSKFESEKTKVKKLQSSLMERAESFVEDSKESILEWKATHDSEKLVHRAQRKEKRATQAIAHALAMVDNAEEAIIEAALAHVDVAENASVSKAVAI